MKVHELSFSGNLLQRGFWLYVWEVARQDGQPLFYVGRTGDSSSTNAQSPFNRMGQHLGFTKNSNMLRKYLHAHNVTPEKCSFRLVALGPLEAESVAETRHEHDLRRDLIAGMEKALANEIRTAGYVVMNEVRSRKELDAVRFAEVRRAFTAAFPKLSQEQCCDPVGLAT